MSNYPLPNQEFNALQHIAHQLSWCTDQLFKQIEQERILDSIIDRIRSSFELETILKITSTALRQLLNVDRVSVFRFTPDSEAETDSGKGVFVAEDVGAEFLSVLEAQVSDQWVTFQFDLNSNPVQVKAIADIDQAELNDCHIQTLKEFQIRASLIVPVLKGEDLWGLICIHQCNSPRRWQLPEIEFVQKIATHFAIVLQQAEHWEQQKHQATLMVQAKAQQHAIARQKALLKITNRIRQSLDFAEICQTTTKEVRQLLDVDRVTIYQFNPDWSGDFRFESVGDGWHPLVGVSPSIADTHLIETSGGRYANHETFAVADIYTVGHSDCHITLLEQFQARAYAVAPIFEGDRLWGLLTAFQNSAPRHWQEDEVELLAQIGEQLGIALRNAADILQIKTQAIAQQQLLEQLQQSQIQLIQNEKMASLGQLVAGVAHEINNPINFIHGNLTHLDDYINDLVTLTSSYQQVNPESVQDIRVLQEQSQELDINFILEDLPKTLASMKIGTDRIRQIVLSLRNFSRLDESEFKLVNIHEGINSTLLILGHRLKAGSDHDAVEVVKTYGDVPWIECYPAQINQVFMNLIANALDAIEDASRSVKLGHAKQTKDYTPKIWISTQMYNSQQITIRIRDNGIGMEEPIKTKVFDHFFTTKPVGKGTGLGLAISNQIICEKHGGTLNFESDRDHGTEFIIQLPIKLQNNSRV